MVVEDVASTSTLDVDAVRGTLVGVIKKQDPMGNTAKWYVDTGVTQGFLPSQKLRPVQRQSQHHDQIISDVAIVGRKSSSPPNLMSLDSPEKEIKKVSSSHQQDLLSLDQETRINHNYSNVPETPRVQMYQNVHNEVSILIFRYCALIIFINVIQFLVLSCDVRFCWKHAGDIAHY